MGTLGYKHTEEAKRKIAAAMVGNTHANEYSRLPETKAKVAVMLRGKPARNYGWMKPKLKATEHPTTLDIAWAAGIYEGEGWCSRVNNGTTTHVGVGQKDHWLLYRLKALFGGSIYEEGKPNGIRSWHIHGARARGFLMTIYSLLSPRRQEQVRAALEQT